MSEQNESKSTVHEVSGPAADGSRAAERFVLHKLLGTGASGAVYSAYDEQRGEEVALKFLTAADPGSLYRFKSEFRLLTHLTHPNLLHLYDLISDGSSWLLSMELIDGTSFLDFVRPLRRSGSSPPTAASDPSPPSVPYSDGDTADVQAATPAAELREDSTTQPEPIVRSSQAHAPRAAQRSEPSVTAPRASSTPPEALVVSTPQRVLDIEARPLDHERLRDALLQLSQGLHALHSASRLHRDLKPANVMVTKPEGRLVICDFGLALLGTLGRTPSGHARLPANDTLFDTGREIAGTPMFMSPEQLAGEPLTVASDWYSVGVMLFLALTGHMPIAQSDRARTHAGLNKPRHSLLPVDPQTLAPSVPEDLAQLALRLMHPDPRRRAGYADLLAVLSASGDHDARHDNAIFNAFLGRESELTTLRAAFETTRDGAPTVAFLCGASGMGKSAVARHFLSQLELSEDALVFSGRCYEHEQLPYKALDPLVDALTTHLLSLTRSEQNELLPRDIELLAGIFRTLRRVRAIAERPKATVLDPHEQRRLAFEALRVLCGSLARKRPLVLFVDDLQWGDSDSAAAFQQLLRPPNAPALLLLCAYRQEAEHRSELVHLLRDAPRQGWALRLAEVKVEPLLPSAAEQIALGLLHNVADAAVLAPRIARESEGNPFLIAQLAHHVATHGVTSAAGLNLDSLIEAKLAGLAPESLTLLSLIALFGRPIAQNTLRDACASNMSKAFRELELRALTLSERHSGENWVECYHDRIREISVRALDAAEASKLHRALAEALERRASSDATALFEHWKGAGERGRAFEYALKAAEGASVSLAFTRAAELYRQALELIDSRGPVGLDVRERLGRALMMAGRGVEAAAVFRALVWDVDARRALQFRMLATTQLLRGGKLAEGFAELERAKNGFGVRFPRSAVGALAALLRRRVEIRIREQRLVVRDAEQPLGEQRARLEALWEVAAAVSNADFLRGSVYAAELMLRVMPSGDPSLLAAALALRAIEAAAADQPVRAQRMIDLAEQAGRASQQDFMVGRVRGMVAICRQLQGRWLESIQLARESQELQKRASRLNWDHAIMIWWELQSASQAGQIALVKQRVPEALRDAEARGDVYAATSFRTHRSSWAWLAMDRSDVAEQEVARAEREWNPGGYQFQHWHMTYARAEIDLYRRTPEASVERLNREWQRARLTREVNGVRTDMLYTRGRLMLAMALHDKRSALLNRSRADARKLIKEPAPWSVGLGLSVLAGVASFDDASSARQLLERAEAQLRAADMLLHAEAARARRAQLERDSDALHRSLEVVRALGIEKPEAFLDLLLPISTAGSTANVKRLALRPGA